MEMALDSGVYLDIKEQGFLLNPLPIRDYSSPRFLPGRPVWLRREKDGRMFKRTGVGENKKERDKPLPRPAPPELNRVPRTDYQGPNLCLTQHAVEKVSLSCSLSPQMAHMLCLEFSVKTISTVENIAHAGDLWGEWSWLKSFP